MTFDEIMEFVSENYPDGTLAMVHECDGADDCGNPLALFIYNELLATYDGDVDDVEQLLNAVMSFELAIDDLDLLGSSLIDFVDTHCDMLDDLDDDDDYLDEDDES